MNTIKKEEVLVNNSNQPHKTEINELKKMNDRIIKN